MFSPTSVETTIAQLIIELSSADQRLLGGLAVISSSTKSNVVICASVRLPVRRNSAEHEEVHERRADD
jgi:hypothetical protein